jgi:hypothetical protein
VAVMFGRLRLYVGRLIMVLSSAGILIADFFGLDHGIHPGTAGVLGSVGAMIALFFYALVACYHLRRGPAVATGGSVTAHAAATTATWLSFALPLPYAAAYRSYRSRTAVLLPGLF